MVRRQAGQKGKIDITSGSPLDKELNVSAKSVLPLKHPQITEIGTGKICGRTGKNRENAGDI